VTGPPGTGKSQVVTNLLVNAAWHGKKVLFSSKNNKAVDVVDFRLNGLGQKPIMLRVGSGQYAFRLSELIEDLLSSNADISDQEEYRYFINLYNEKSKEKKKLQDQKDQLIFLRNRIDRVEQEICTFRDYNGQYNKKITDSDIDALKRASDNLTVVFLKSQKEKQPFFTRIFWAAIEGKRKQALNDSIQNINPYLRKLNLPLVLENVNGDQINIIGNKIQEQIHFFEVISEYEALLEQLSSLDPLESIDNKLFILKKELANVAEKLWNKWLVTRPLQISATDRREMAQFVAAMKLYGNGDISNDRELNSQFRKLQGKMSAHLPCWAVTSLSAHTRVPFTAGLFDLVVIDEASQCDIASALPLLYRAKRAVIIGDPKQLSHISSISDKQDATLLRKYDVGFDYSYSAMSLYAHASSIVDSQDIVILRDHHRSHADIIEFSNKEFYDGKLRVVTNYDRLSLPQKSKPGIRWVDVIGNTERPSSGSAYNEKEASVVVNEIRRLVLDNQYKGSVGVVTPFRAQADKIRDLISKDDELNKYLLFNNDFLVDTVHKFQGDERDVMFFSATISRNALEGTIRFLSNTGNLFNVAITRARSMLVVVGDGNYCLNCNVKYLQNFVSYIQSLESGQRQNVNYFTTPTNEIYPNVSNPEEVSDWEKTLFTALYKAGIVTIPQYPVDKYKLDLAFFDGDRKLDIEVDGEMYHRDWNGELSYRDQLRNQRLYEMGWDVKRYWVYQVRDQLPQCIDQIRKWKEKA
jgi:Superfamily I DNA and RNA helicases and helicase subunits